MDRLIRWCKGLLPVLALTLVLIACTGGADLSQKGVSNKDKEITPPVEPTAVVDSDDRYISITVIVTDEGFQPPSIFIPVGQKVRLVLRNRGSTEHHFRVLALKIRDLKWLAPLAADVGEDDDAQHEAHHMVTSFVPFRDTSPAGIKPLGDEVHAYAQAGGQDMVIFTPTDTGNFLVHCPLHPEIIGHVIVY